MRCTDTGSDSRRAVSSFTESGLQPEIILQIRLLELLEQAEIILQIRP